MRQSLSTSATIINIESMGLEPEVCASFLTQFFGSLFIKIQKNN